MILLSPAHAGFEAAFGISQGFAWGYMLSLLRSSAA